MIEKPASDFAFRFTESDLKENRRGRLSDAQAAVLRRDVLQVAGGIGGALLIVTVLSLLSAQSAPSEFALVILLILAPVAIILALYVGRTEMAIQPRAVTPLTGEVNLTHLPYSSLGRYTLEMSDQKFSLTRDQIRALRPGVYTIYFVPGIRKIVSVEPLDHLPTERPEPPPLTLERFDDDSQDTLRA